MTKFTPNFRLKISEMVRGNILMIFPELVACASSCFICVHVGVGTTNREEGGREAERRTSLSPLSPLPLGAGV